MTESTPGVLGSHAQINHAARQEEEAFRNDQARWGQTQANNHQRLEQIKTKGLMYGAVVGIVAAFTHQTYQHLKDTPGEGTLTQCTLWASSIALGYLGGCLIARQEAAGELPASMR